MTQWCRLWEDMPTDPKWRIISRRSGRPINEIVAVFCVMMTNASASSKRGSLSSWDDEVVGAALDMEEHNVRSIREAMQAKVLNGNDLMGWEKRQPKREDTSGKERLAAYRQRQSDAKRNETRGNETVSLETQQNASETHRNASKRARGEENREEEKERKRDSNESLDRNAKNHGVGNGSLSLAFGRFWEKWPNKVAKPAAKLAFKKVEHELEKILAGVDRYAASKPADRAWMHPATFLNGRRWEDQPAAVVEHDPRSPFPPGTLWSRD